MPRSSVQASKTGDDTKSSQIPSKDNLVGEAMSVLFLIASVLYASSAHGRVMGVIQNIPQYHCSLCWLVLHV